MKPSISNIAWARENDDVVYSWMRENNFTGLEIAPTAIFPNAPYDNLQVAKDWSKKLAENYGLVVCSLQSIWYGRNENIFGSSAERQILLDYTKKAIDFANVVGARNLVFGCPKNRNIPYGMSKAEAWNIASNFFSELADYAKSNNTVLALEANPTIYNTNFLNTTRDVIKMVSIVDNIGCLCNLDIGTVIQNNEDIISLLNVKIVHLINHVHISEPYLRPIKKRSMHQKLMQILQEHNYNKFISIEMGKTEELKKVFEVAHYLWKLI